MGRHDHSSQLRLCLRHGMARSSTIQSPERSLGARLGSAVSVYGKEGNRWILSRQTKVLSMQ